MTKPAADGKRAKISQSQQYMIFAVFGAAIFLGAAIAVVINSINKISFHASVIMAQDQSITTFSDTIKNIGICKKPAGKVYTDDELKKCTPNGTTTSSVPGTLRANIIENMASNANLASVPNENDANCLNPKTNKNYTYKELEEEYNNAVEAKSDEDASKAINRIMTCSALRVIPDALPASKNEEALLASVNKIFLDSGTEPESLSPSDDADWAPFGTNLYYIPVRIHIESDAGTVNTLLNNIERSIRTINIERATIEWSSNNTLDFRTSNANAYYMTPSTITVMDKSIKPGGKK